MKTQILHVKRAGDNLQPADEDAIGIIRRLPVNKRIDIRVWKERSAEQNALYWRILEKTVEATGRWHTANELHLALKVACGYVDKVMLLDGRLVLVPGSIAFDRMNQEEAQRYYDAALRIVCEEIMEMPLEDLIAA